MVLTVLKRECRPRWRSEHYLWVESRPDGPRREGSKYSEDQPKHGDRRTIERTGTRTERWASAWISPSRAALCILRPTRFQTCVAKSVSLDSLIEDGVGKRGSKLISHSL